MTRKDKIDAIKRIDDGMLRLLDEVTKTDKEADELRARLRDEMFKRDMIILEEAADEDQNT